MKTDHRYLTNDSGFAHFAFMGAKGSWVCVCFVFDELGLEY